MYKYTHVDAFYQIVRYVENIRGRVAPPYCDMFTTPVLFRGTVKLHGSNSGVACLNGSIQAQSRNRIISAEDDNMGFGAFVQEKSQAIASIERDLRAQHQIDPAQKLVLYGEWIGPGIQNGMAINKLPEKQWVIFAVKAISDEGEDDEGGSYLDIVPRLHDLYAEERIHSVYDALTYELEVDFSSQQSKEAAAEYFESITQKVEDSCPWGKRFGIDGMGEGVVWIPVGEHWGDSELFWKSKGPKHKQVKRAKRNLPPLDPEVVKSTTAFLEFAVTENRLKQGVDYLREMGHPLESRSIPHYIKWVGQDVKRECSLELKDNELDWKQVSKAVNRKALDYFKGFLQNSAVTGS